MAYALTENPADAFCRLAIHGDRVDLEFGLGSEFPDPERRLKGKGRGTRRLSMASLDDVRDASVGRFLRAAILAGEQSKDQTGKRSAPRPVVRGVYAGPAGPKKDDV